VPEVDELLAAAASAAVYWALAVANCRSAAVPSTVARTCPDFTCCPTFTSTEVTGSVDELKDRLSVVLG
jgi:hypothetical protein